MASNIIELSEVSYEYSGTEASLDKALNNVSLNIKMGEFIGIAGHTGSGKTTAAQIMAGLAKPTSGKIYVNGKLFEDYTLAARELRKYVGIVFQYPEHQLFEETVYKDIAFGLKNKGTDERETDRLVRECAALVHVHEKNFDKSPFELSGGQKRRVAIAGVLVTNPSVLILDEPAAGLDPIGRNHLLSYLHDINKSGKTIVLISHSMEELAENTDRIIVLNHGKKVKDDVPTNVFSDGQMLKSSGLEMPEIAKILKILRDNGIETSRDIFTVQDAYKEILEKLGGI